MATENQSAISMGALSVEGADEAIGQTADETTDTMSDTPAATGWRGRLAQAFSPTRGGDPDRAFAFWFYALIFLLVDALGVMLLQWAVTLVDPTSGFLNWVGLIFASHNFVFVLNLILLGFLYLALIALFNRFWVASPVFIVLVTIIAVAERLKVMVRNETILPSDLKIAGSNAGELTQFIPAGSQGLAIKIPIFLIVFVLLCVIMSRRDGRAPLIRLKNLGAHVVVRVLLVLAPLGFMAAYASALGTVGSWSYNTSIALGDGPRLWDSVLDAQGNGTLLAFMRFTNPKVMDVPKDYSQATMEKVAARYAKEAEAINQGRQSNLTDNSVVMVLSESFSDPTRVPGLKLNKDPMPKIRALKKRTTSGLFLSSGYGGGTANLEFQALFGLSMANFDPSLSSPYEQLVPKLKWTSTFNSLWNNTADGSLAFHPYISSMYSRSSNYKKFGFEHFWTLDKPEVIEPQQHLDSSPYVSDQSAYGAVLKQLTKDTGQEGQHKFYQLVTMQNHMSYDNWYNNNEFQASSTTGVPLEPDETSQIQTYAKGMSYTDTATLAFLDQLNRVDKPVTVIFYGDHLPGVYSSASQDSKNSLSLHETDYFIWSNKASKVAGRKLPAADSAYTSPNFLMAQTAEQLGAKVSPYLAFLTELHRSVAAMEPPVVNHIQQWYRIPEGTALYLNPAGQMMDTSKLSAKDKQLLNDYKLIQYDLTAGKDYLRDLDFMQLPIDKDATKVPAVKAKSAAGEDKAGKTDKSVKSDKGGETGDKTSAKGAATKADGQSTETDQAATASSGQ